MPEKINLGVIIDFNENEVFLVDLKHTDVMRKKEIKSLALFTELLTIC